MAEQSANDPAFDRFAADAKRKRREQIRHDVVVIAGVERNVIAA